LDTVSPWAYKAELRPEGIDINIIPDNEISNKIEIEQRIILSNTASVGGDCVK